MKEESFQAKEIDQENIAIKTEPQKVRNKMGIKEKSMSTYMNNILSKRYKIKRKTPHEILREIKVECEELNFHRAIRNFRRQKLRKNNNNASMRMDNSYQRILIKGSVSVFPDSIPFQRNKQVQLSLTNNDKEKFQELYKRIFNVGKYKTGLNSTKLSPLKLREDTPKTSSGKFINSLSQKKRLKHHRISLINRIYHNLHSQENCLDVINRLSKELNNEY